MKERPILMSAPMVRAILSGAKTQTRRVVNFKGAPPSDAEAKRLHPIGFMHETGFDGVRCPYGAPGDRLWVRETWHQCPHCGEGDRYGRRVAYRAGGWMREPSGAPDDNGDRNDSDARPLAPKCTAHGWRPSIHMPRWASRITLEVTGVRVERLHDIRDDDAKAEGVAREQGRDGPPAMGGGVETWHDYEHPEGWVTSPRASFVSLWRSVYGAESWAANPWVWAITFRRVTP